MCASCLSDFLHLVAWLSPESSDLGFSWGCEGFKSLIEEEDEAD